MELEEIETINLRDTALPFACSWSEDHTLSVLTEHEVHILKQKPFIRSIDNIASFHRQSIKARDVQPKEDFPQIKEIMLRENRENVYNIINESVLTPVSKMFDSSSDSLPRPSYCCWSPAGVVNQSQCALLFLNNMGNVDVQISQGQSWMVVNDLTKIYSQEMMSSFCLEPTYQMIKDSIYQLSTTCIDWSPMYCDSKYSFIVLGQLNGDVLIWKFYNLNFPQLESSPKLLKKFPLNQVCLTSIHWIKVGDNSAIIIAGCLNGITKSLFVHHLDEELSEIKEQILWSSDDNIRVDKILSEKLDSNYLILVIKRSNIIICLISSTGLLLHTRVQRIGNLSISGCEPLGSGSYAISTLTSYIAYINIFVSNNAIAKIQLSEIKHSVNRTYMSTSGICCSRNKAIWIVCSNYCKSINHLIIREPVQLYLCASSAFDVENVLLKNPTQKLTAYWDCLELSRLKHDKKESLIKLYPSLDNYDETSVYQLKIFMWTALLCENMIKKRKRTVNSEFIPSDDLKTLVTIKSALEQLDKLIQKHKIKKLIAFDLLSVRYLRGYLKSSLSTEIFGTYLGNVTKKKIETLIAATNNLKLPKSVKCSWCNSDFVETGECEKSHTENQCAITFVPFSDILYAACPDCNCSAHPNVDRSELICPFCDNAMTYSVYLQDS